jgi:hypothetical protein
MDAPMNCSVTKADICLISPGSVEDVLLEKFNKTSNNVLKIVGEAEHRNK